MELRRAGVRRAVIDGVELELLPLAPEVRVSHEDPEAMERRARAEAQAEADRLLYWSAGS